MSSVWPDNEDEQFDIVARFETYLGPYGPVLVTVIRDEDGSFLASEDVADCYGVAAMPELAVLELAEAVKRQHAWLREAPAPHLLAQLHALDTLENTQPIAARAG